MNFDWLYDKSVVLKKSINFELIIRIVIIIIGISISGIFILGECSEINALISFSVFTPTLYCIIDTYRRVELYTYKSNFYGKVKQISEKKYNRIRNYQESIK